MSQEIEKYFTQTPHRILLDHVDMPEGDIGTYVEILSQPHVISSKLRLRTFRDFGIQLVTINPYDRKTPEILTPYYKEKSVVLLEAMRKLDIAGNIYLHKPPDAESIFGLMSIGIRLDEGALESVRELLGEGMPFVSFELSSSEVPVWIFSPDSA